MPPNSMVIRWSPEPGLSSCVVAAGLLGDVSGATGLWQAVTQPLPVVGRCRRRSDHRGPRRSRRTAPGPFRCRLRPPRRHHRRHLPQRRSRQSRRSLCSTTRRQCRRHQGCTAPGDDAAGQARPFRLHYRRRRLDHAGIRRRRRGHAAAGPTRSPTTATSPPSGSPKNWFGRRASAGFRSPSIVPARSAATPASA